MRICKIKFRITVIALKIEINMQDEEIGTLSGNVYLILNYLKRLGLNFSLQRLYSLKKPVEFLIEGDNLNCLDYLDYYGHGFIYKKIFAELRKDNLPIHVRIERI